MQSPTQRPSRWLGVLAVVAVVFGLATIISGGRTLFDAETQRRAGNFVAFVLWFNFLAGFAYVIAGVGIWLWQRWSVWLSIAITVATLVIFAAFGIQIWRGGSYEMRTVVAMGLRAATWIVVSAVVYVKLANTRKRAIA